MPTEWDGDKLAMIEAATERLREVIREANGVRKDLMKASKMLDRKLEEFDAVVAKHMAEAVRTSTQELLRTYKKVGEESVQRMYDRFDEITNILLGRDINDPEDETMVEIAKRVRQAMDRHRHGLPKVPDFWRRTQ